MAAVAVAVPVVAGAVPGLRVFAVSFMVLVGAMVVLAVARSALPRLPVPVPTILVVGGVAASIAATIIFLLREPDAAEYLAPSAAVYLAVVLVGCLWVAVAMPLWSGTSRLAPHLGVAAAVVSAAGFWLMIRTDGSEPPFPVVLLLTVVLPLAPLAVFSVPAFMAGRRSFRSGLQAAIWTVIAMVPLTFTVWLFEGLRRHAIDGRSLLSEGEQAPVGANLTDALLFSFGIFPIICFTLALIGAGLGARMTQPERLSELGTRRPFPGNR